MTRTLASPTRRRFRLQFSLRTLLVLVAVVSLPCAWLTMKMREGARQRAALVALDLVDGGKHYAHTQEGSEPMASPPGLAWLRAILGDDVFQRVDWVNLNGEEYSQSQWEQLEALDTIRTMYFCGAPTRDTDLVHLSGFKQLEMLHLCRCPGITDAALVHLENLTALRELDLWETRVTTAGVKRLHAKLPKCKIDYGTLATGHRSQPPR